MTPFNPPSLAPGLWPRLQQGWAYLCRLLDALQPLAALSARLYVAQVFFLSGLTKLRYWDTTLNGGQS